MRFRILTLATLLGMAVVTSAQAPAPSQGQPGALPGDPNGAAVFDRACASCHSGQTAAPTRDTLRAFSPEAIVTALTVGKMAAQGSALSPAEHRAVAEFLTGRAPAAGGTATAAANRCTAPTPTTDPARAPGWTGWGNDLTNRRFASDGSLTAADLPRLKLIWAFGYAGVSAARAQPAMAGDKLFVASENAEVHALHPKTGCSYWTFKADAGVRSALTVGPYKTAAGSGYAVFFGDGQANAYAVDAVTGQQIWKRKIDTHASAGITGGLVVYDNKVFVPVQGLNEEGQGGRGGYACCTFRGSLSALDASTGEPIWKTYMVDEPQLRGKNRTGQDAFGPAGGGIWSAPTIDVTRRAVYVATGNGYADPPQPMTDAVVAMDLDTGQVKWVNQVTPNDNWAGGCGPTNPDNPGCPDVQGPDHDFSAAPALATTPDGRQLLIVPQKSGLAYAMDPDSGKTVWQYRMGQGSGLGGQWGAAVDGERAYFGVNDFLTQNPGGMRAVRLANGEQVWSAGPPSPPLCASAAPAGGARPGGAPAAGGRPAGPPPAAAPQGPPPGAGAPGAGRGGRGRGRGPGGGGFGGGGGRGCSAAQGGAVTAIPGAVLGVSLDGGVRAYSAEDGKILWVFDTNRQFETVNGVQANGGGIDGSALIVVDGMIYLNSGYGGIVGRPGNVLLAFGVE